MRRVFRVSLILFLLAAALILGGCALRRQAASGAPAPLTTSTPVPSPTPEATADPVMAAWLEEQERRSRDVILRAEALAAQYDYDAALALLDGSGLAGERMDAAAASLRARRDALVPYEGELRHIFFHSLIVYPEMIFTDRVTPMGDYNAGFSEKAELERILPQLYDRGYVLYDLRECYEMTEHGMERKEILLPPDKTPLILSVDDVAYAYGSGFARRLYVDETGALMYEVPNPSGGVDVMPDGDVMGVVDAFVEAHPDFSWRGCKGTIALTGFQGAFGYPDYESEDDRQAIARVADALKADGWSFASHSYTHNGGQYGFWGAGCNPENIRYDINKWVDKVTPCIGTTELFLAPFGYRAQGQALDYVLQCGFTVYCTVDRRVVNELYPNYALQSRIEIGGYSMTYYRDLLNELFFRVDDVFDSAGRPPVI